MRPPRFTLVVLLLLVAAAFAIPGTAAAKRSGCHGLHLHATKHKIALGGSLRLSGTICHRRVAARQVRIVVHGPHGLRAAVKARVRRNGHFTRRVRLGRAKSAGKLHFRARHRASRSNGVVVRVAPRPSSARTAGPAGGPAAEVASSAPAPVPAEAAPASSCPSGPEPTVAVAMTSTGCPTVASDTGAGSPLSFWGSIQCAESSRYQTIASGGAPEPTATGEPQGNSSYRQMTLFDGDNFYGARCELGLNDYRSGPTAFYHEGERAVTYYSERLPSNFPLSTTRWQTVMQMKQAQPSHDGGGGVAIEMEARHGRWVVEAGWKELWSFPAKAGSWTRFAWDVYYSKDPAKGWLQVSADLNGDGSFEGPGERSPVLHTATLATEVSGYPGDGIPAGAAIPSHLRMGIYHDPAISCPAPQGCSVDVDDVQVVR